MLKRYFTRFPRGRLTPDPSWTCQIPKREDRSQPPFLTRVALYTAYAPGTTYSEIRCKVQKDFRLIERERGLEAARQACWPETYDAAKEAGSRLTGIAEQLYWLAKAILLGIGK